MKKCVYLAILGTLVALLALAGGISPAFASTGQAIISQTKSTQVGRTKRFHFHPPGQQTHNQSFHGNTYSHTYLIFHCTMSRLLAKSQERSARKGVRLCLAG